MGSVGSLVERQDLSPVELRAPLGGVRGLRQPDGLLRKGLSQRELLGYLHGPRREARPERKCPGGSCKRDYESDRENCSPERSPRGADFSKSSLPERGRFDKVGRTGLGQCPRVTGVSWGRTWPRVTAMLPPVPRMHPCREQRDGARGCRSAGAGAALARPASLRRGRS